MRRFTYILRLSKTMIQLMRGVWKLLQDERPKVTIFGGARVLSDSEYAKLAHDLTHLLVEENISVITGGGPGIMKEATCAVIDEHVQETDARSISISVKNLTAREPLNRCARDSIIVEYFFARKWLMINFSMGFAVFPGGFGTLDELFEVLTLVQTHMLTKVPIVLIGKSYWQPLIDWAKKELLERGLIQEQDIKLLHITDDMQEAFCILKDQCKACKQCVIEMIDMPEN